MSEAQALKREIRQELQAKGYSVSMLDIWPAKATYYKPTGEAMPNLPADPFSMKRYLKRGYTLTPPEKPVKAKPDPSAKYIEEGE